MTIKLAARPGAKFPQYMTPGAAGADLFACLDAPLWIAPGGRTLIPTGLFLEIPFGIEGSIRARSGLALKQGLVAFNGLIDSDYRGEVQVLLFNYGTAPIQIANGDRIAQIVFSPVVAAGFEAVTLVSSTARGAGGFGSTSV